MSKKLRHRLSTISAAATAELPRIDREAGIIRGASAMQAVEALGHGMLIDQVTLAQVRDLGNAAPGGIKVRFTHPGLCSDGMGKMLGRQRNFSIQGDRVVGDIHLADVAAKAPDGDLRGYVLDLAEEDPASFGMSVVISLHTVWKLADGSEIATDDPSLRRGRGEDSYFARPDAATTDTPICRVDELHASDVVDEPAANRAGLFAAAFSGTTSFDAAQAFSFLDQARERFGLGAADLRSFLSRYLTTRGLAAAQNPKGEPMKITPQRLAELCNQHQAFAAHIINLAAGDKDEAEILASIEQLKASAAHAELTAKLAKAEQDLASAQTAHAAALKAETEKVADLTAKLAALQTKHDALAKLANGAPPDVGGSPTATPAEKDPLAEANLKAAWDSNEKLRESFGGDFDALKALARDDKPLALEALAIKA